MNSGVKLTYGPQRAYGYAMKFIAVYGIGILIGILAVSKGWQVMGTIVSVLFGFMMIITLMQTTALGSHYTISPEKITAFHFFKKKELPYASIRQFQLLSFEEAVKVMSKYDTDEAIRAGKMDLKEAMHVSMEMGKVLHFCTIQVKFAEHNIAKKKTSFIYLETKEGESFLWSPKDSPAFFKQVQLFRKHQSS